MPQKYQFCFGPWNISEGADPFGTEVRKVFPHEEKFALIARLDSRACSFMTMSRGVPAGGRPRRLGVSLQPRQ